MSTTGYSLKGENQSGIRDDQTEEFIRDNGDPREKVENPEAFDFTKNSGYLTMKFELKDPVSKKMSSIKMQGTA
jgi:hypothetical protein